MKFYTSVSRYGNNLLYRGYKDGRRVQKKVPFKPHLYIASPSGVHKALDSVAVARVDFESMSDASAHVKSYSDVDGYQIYGITDYVAQYIQQEYPGKIEYNPDIVNVVSLDIEVHSTGGFPEADKAEWPIDAITLKSSRSETYTVFTTLSGNVEMSELLEKGIKLDQIKLIHCDTEEELLLRLLTWWNDPINSPDVVTGWNIRAFDIPYLINRTIRVLGEDKGKEWSPWRKIQQEQIFIKGRGVSTYEMVGIAQLDYMDAFKKFGHSYGPQESYRLDHIAHVVLDERKMSYDEYSGLRELREKNPGRYLAYNVKDTWLIARFEDKLGLIDLILTMAYKAGVNYNDCFGTTKIWDTIIYRKLTDRDVVVPPRKNNRKSSFVGGYVKEPHVGLHDWVVSCDLNSLYPNIIVEYNMSPETLCTTRYPNVSIHQALDAKFNVTSDTAVAANGAKFRKDFQGIIPEIIVEYYAERKQIKSEMIEAKRKKEQLQKELAELEHSAINSLDESNSLQDNQFS